MTLFKSIFASILLGAASMAHALDIMPYSASALAAAQTANQSVALHFHADWCPTCRAQASVLQELKSEAGLPITVMVVNYDNEKQLRRSLKVRSQSVFIVYKGFVERARLAGDTSKDAIRAGLKAGL